MGEAENSVEIKKLQVELIRQEHRLWTLICNWSEHKKPGSDPSMKSAARSALMWRLIFFFFAGGSVGLVGMATAIATWSSSGSDVISAASSVSQTEQITEQTSLIRDQTAILSSQTDLIKTQNSFLRKQLSFLNWREVARTKRLSDLVEQLAANVALARDSIIRAHMSGTRLRSVISMLREGKPLAEGLMNPGDTVESVIRRQTQIAQYVGDSQARAAARLLAEVARDSLLIDKQLSDAFLSPLNLGLGDMGFPFRGQVPLSDLSPKGFEEIVDKLVEGMRPVSQPPPLDLITTDGFTLTPGMFMIGEWAESIHHAQQSIRDRLDELNTD